MKKTIVLAMMASLLLVSCGGQKSVASNQPSYQNQYSQQQVQPAPAPAPAPTYGEDVREEKVDPWFEAQSQATDKLRGAASYTSTNKAVAVRIAQTLAAENLAAQIEQVVSSATRMIMSEMGLNQEHIASTQYAADIKTKIVAKIGINTPIKTWTRTLKNGNYEIGYCMEMQMTKKELAAYLAGEMEKELKEEFQEIGTLTEDQKATVEDMSNKAVKLLEDGFNNLVY